MNLNFIEKIRDESDIKLVKSYCNKVLKKLSFKSAKDLQNLYILAELMYIYDRFEDAIRIAEIVEDIKFNGNYTIWTKIEIIRSIVIRIMHEYGKDIEAKNILDTLIPWLNPSLYDNQKKLLAMYDRDIENAINNISLSNARDWMLIKFGIMISYYEKPGFPINKETFNQDIIELKNELRKIIK